MPNSNAFTQDPPQGHVKLLDFSLSSIRMEERAGERRCGFIGFPSPRSSPHSFLAGRGCRA
jgi:hypothetical protein